MPLVSRSSLLHGAHDGIGPHAIRSPSVRWLSRQGPDGTHQIAWEKLGKTGRLVFTASYDAGDMIIYYIYVMYVYIYIIYY